MKKFKITLFFLDGNEEIECAWEGEAANTREALRRAREDCQTPNLEYVGFGTVMEA